jgi:hypothetical protein
VRLVIQDSKAQKEIEVMKETGAKLENQELLVQLEKKDSRVHLESLEILVLKD